MTAEPAEQSDHRQQRRQAGGHPVGHINSEHRGYCCNTLRGHPRRRSECPRRSPARSAQPNQPVVSAHSFRVCSRPSTCQRQVLPAELNPPTAQIARQMRQRAVTRSRSLGARHLRQGPCFDNLARMPSAHVKGDQTPASERAASLGPVPGSHLLTLNKSCRSRVRQRIAGVGPIAALVATAFERQHLPQSGHPRWPAIG